MLSVDVFHKCSTLWFHVNDHVTVSVGEMVHRACTDMVHRATQHVAVRLIIIIIRQSRDFPQTEAGVFQTGQTGQVVQVWLGVIKQTVPATSNLNNFHLGLILHTPNTRTVADVWLDVARTDVWLSNGWQRTAPTDSNS